MQRRIARWMFRRLLSTDTRLVQLLLRKQPTIERLAFYTVLVLYPLFCLLSWLRIAWRHLWGLKPAVLWAPTPILTIAESSELLRRLGYPSTTLVFTVYFITRNFDLNLQPLIYNPAIVYWLPHALFLWALLNFDIFHFFYDGGLWSGMKIVPRAKWLELPLLRLAGKRIIASAYGADVRVRALNELWQPYNLCQECPEPGKHCICDAANGAINTKYYRDWCNVLLAMGDMYDYVPGSRMDFNYWPIDVNKVPYVGVVPHTGPVKLVHSPNHRFFKGTRFFETAVAALQAKGYALELILVERVSNAEAKRMYAEADIVVAQCIAGWMGYTEIEAMAAGKPVLGYIRNADYLAHSPGCPLVSASPDTLEAALEALVSDPALRQELGRRGREYVEREWSYEALAPRYDALHQEVWKHNRLGRTLWAKWTEYASRTRQLPASLAALRTATHIEGRTVHMRWAKRLAKPLLQRFVRRIVRAEGIITAPQLEALETRLRMTCAPDLETLEAKIETLMASELETLETRIQCLTDEVHSLRGLVHYLLSPDSDSSQQRAQKDAPSFTGMPATVLQAAHTSARLPTGQPLKILHIGNIANNAYHLAKILNEAGLACDVLCYNYYHVMGSPEWEDADFIGSVDEWTPEWDSVNLQGFQRPRWFAQGPLHLGANYLYARRKRHLFEAANLWPELTFKFASVPSTKPMVLHPSPEPCLSDADCQGLVHTFAQAFPERRDKLQQADLDTLQFYTRHVDLFKSLFAEYDIVQGYATDPIWSLLAGQRPYVAFEHGTIRQIPFDDDPVGRLTALAYHQADGVIITNGDNNHAAERLKLTDYRFIPHAVNEKWLQPGLGQSLREQLRQELDTDFVVLHPARQHWEAQRDLNWEKGNDIFIEGLARFIHEVAPRATAVFVEWGKKVAESKALLEQLGIARRVQWIPLQHNCGLSRYVDACDIVADQFYIGAFGNIMPKALAHGKPAILYVDEARHRWCFPEMPPVINARTPDEVYRGLTRAYRDRGWLQELAEAGLRWYRTYHSNAVIRERLMTLYHDVLARYSKQL